MAQLALAEGVLLLPTCARLIIHHTKPPPAHRARCPYAQRLCSLALLMCSPAQAVTFAVAVVQRGAWPMDSFNLREAWSQVVGRGGGGHGHHFRGHRAGFAASVLRFSCSDHMGWGSGVDAYAGPAHSQCTYVQFGVKIIFIDPWDMVGTLAVVLGTHDKDLENLG